MYLRRIYTFYILLNYMKVSTQQCLHDSVSAILRVYFAVVTTTERDLS